MPGTLVPPSAVTDTPPPLGAVPGTPSPHRRRLPSVPVLAGIAAAVVALAVLFVPSSIGVADNADYARLTCQLGLRPSVPSGMSPGEAYVYFGTRRGSPSRYELCEYRSPALEPLRVGMWISELIPGAGPLDLRVVGAIYALGFGAAVGLIVSALPGTDRPRLMMAAVAIVVLADVGLVAWFTSAYSEPLGYVGLLAVTGMLMRHWRRPSIGQLLVATAIGFVLITTKPQYGPLALVLAPAVLVCPLPRLPRPRWRSQLPRMLASLALVVAGGIAINGTPDFIAQANRFNAYFYGLLGHSPNVQADLAEFALPAELSRYAGRPIWTTPEALSDPNIVPFEKKVSHAGLAGFYLRHPRRASSLAARGFRAGSDPQVPYLANYSFDQDRPPRQRACRLCVFSTVGGWTRPAAPVLIPLLWIGSLLVGWRRIRRSRDPAERALGGGLVVVTGIALVSFGTAVLGEADYEFTKHLFLASASDALLVVLLVAVGVDRFVRHRSSLSETDTDEAEPESEPLPALSGMTDHRLEIR